MNEELRRKELADFLKNRRQRLTPEAAGLPVSIGIRRRTRGLRREEVATLAGISLHWYTALEQGRDIRVSESVLDSLAHTLQLKQEEKVHLYTLANRNLPIESYSDSFTAAASDPALQLIIDQFGHMPVYAIDGKWNLLAWNASAAELFGGFRMTCKETGVKNLLWLLFYDPDFRGRFMNWDQSASRLVAAFRTFYARRMDDPCLKDMVEDLGRGSAEFREIWDRHDVQCLHENRFRILHAGAGEIHLYSNAFNAAEREDVTLVVYTPASPVDGERLKKMHERMLNTGALLGTAN